MAYPGKKSSRKVLFFFKKAMEIYKFLSYHISSHVLIQLVGKSSRLPEWGAAP